MEVPTEVALEKQFLDKVLVEVAHKFGCPQDEVLKALLFEFCLDEDGIVSLSREAPAKEREYDIHGRKGGDGHERRSPSKRTGPPDTHQTRASKALDLDPTVREKRRLARIRSAYCSAGQRPSTVFSPAGKEGSPGKVPPKMPDTQTRLQWESEMRATKTQLHQLQVDIGLLKTQFLTKEKELDRKNKRLDAVIECEQEKVEQSNQGKVAAARPDYLKRLEDERRVQTLTDAVRALEVENRALKVKNQKMEASTKVAHVQMLNNQMKDMHQKMEEMERDVGSMEDIKADRNELRDALRQMKIERDSYQHEYAREMAGIRRTTQAKDDLQKRLDALEKSGDANEDSQQDDVSAAGKFNVITKTKNGKPVNTLTMTDKHLRAPAAAARPEHNPQDYRLAKEKIVASQASEVVMICERRAGRVR